MSCSKQPYSQKDANTIANAFGKGKRKMVARNKVPVRAYYCSECHAYHLTSQRVSKHRNKTINEDV